MQSQHITHSHSFLETILYIITISPSISMPVSFKETSQKVRGEFSVLKFKVAVGHWTRKGIMKGRNTDFIFKLFIPLLLPVLFMRNVTFSHQKSAFETHSFFFFFHFRKKVNFNLFRIQFIDIVFSGDRVFKFRINNVWKQGL